ncbi:MAG: hypothetical protein JWN30_64, partial [Bacilli bacterium]|nr:hypothetical protein [Bacilli bacterium]
QSFAIFPEPRHSASAQLRETLKSIDVYREQIISSGRYYPLLTKSHLSYAIQHGLRAGLLTLEGAHCLCEDLGTLRNLFQLGIRSIGLTWNYQNCLGSGVREGEDLGLTAFGQECVQEMQRLGILVDVAHLGSKGVEQVIRDAKLPVICSHGNAYRVHPHVRNLQDEQIIGIASTGGYVGITFVPYFISMKQQVCIEDLLPHIDHLLNLVGEEHVALGSDFDGIDQTMVDLDRGRSYPLLIAELEQRYGRRVTEKIAFYNVIRVLMQTLPAD